MRSTHTLATLAVSVAAHDEIRFALVTAGHDHAVLAEDDGAMLDMTGIGLVPAEPSSAQPADPDEGWHWSWGDGSEPETISKASQNTREAAEAEALDEATNDFVTICQARPVALRDDVFDADHAIERWHDANEEAQDENGDLGMEPTHAQRADLEAALAKAFADWRKRHGLGRTRVVETRHDEVLRVPSDDGGFVAGDDGGCD